MITKSNPNPNHDEIIRMTPSYKWIVTITITIILTMIAGWAAEATFTDKHLDNKIVATEARVLVVEKDQARVLERLQVIVDDLKEIKYDVKALQKR